jgi:hypothetical protein
MDDALRSFEGVLAGKPTNLVALLGKVLLIVHLTHHCTDCAKGPDIIRQTAVPSGSKIIPTSPAVQPSMYTRPAHRYRSVSVGHGP